MNILIGPPESATRTLRRLKLEPAEHAPEMAACVEMLQGHIADAAERASRRVKSENADAIEFRPDYVFARGGNENKAER
jgi:hypothetical protein